MSDGLIHRIEQAADRGEDVVFLDGDTPAPLPWAVLHDEARAMAAALQARGVGPGSRVAMLAATSRPLVSALQGCWLAGAAVIMLPLRTRVESDGEYRARTRERIALGDVALTLTDPDLADMAGPGPRCPLPVALPALGAEARRTGSSAYERPADDPEATTILQFTSGSTADPKGVVIPQRCLLDNLDAVVDRSPVVVGDDVIVSWLPLYHDMGLVYNAALAMTTGVRFALSSPQGFVSSPSSWMEHMAALGATWTIGPNFAFVMAGRLLARAAGLDLSRCRRMGSGSEPVDPDVMDRFAAAASAHDFDARALYAGYGMAEATVAVSLPGLGTGFATDTVDGAALELERHAAPVDAAHPSARRLARCGPPLRGFEVRITEADTGHALDDRAVGEIELRGPSVVPGYFRRPDATAAAFRPGGWLRTGDLGYQVDGELVVCGRLKDLIIVGGRNVFPEDLERSVHEVEGVRAGNVIAFGIAGGRRGESVVVVAELKAGDPAAVRDAVARAVRSSVGIRPDDVVLLAPGTLPKTSSGKLRRSLCRARYQAAELETL